MPSVSRKVWFIILVAFCMGLNAICNWLCLHHALPDWVLIVVFFASLFLVVYVWLWQRELELME